VEVRRAERRLTPRRAALRLSLRGRLPRAHDHQGRNRDTAWFAILGQEWPALRAAFEAWLEPANFDADGGQQRALGEMVAERR